MNIFVHIGYPKTGTSWLQQKVFPSIKETTFIPPGKVIDTFFRENSFLLEPELIRKQLVKESSKNILLSDHGFIGTTHNFGLHGYLTQEHARRIYQVFPEANILIFIRKQTDIIASSYMQYVKEGGTNSINKYLFHKNFSGLNSLIMFSFEHFEYHNIIQFYKSLFGENNVFIYLYEELLDNPRLFISNFCKETNLSLEIDNLDFSKVNLGYRQHIKSLALIANRFTEQKIPNKYYLFHIPGWLKFSKRALKYLNKSPLVGKYLDPIEILGKKNYSFITEYYKKSNRLLIEKHHLSKILKFKYPL